MTDLERARKMLESGSYTCVLCKGDIVFTSRKTGISPMLDFLDDGMDFTGFTAADTIVGKAAAFLFVMSGVKELYAQVLSETAVPVLKRHAVRFSCGTLTSAITNRRGDGICPMEETVTGINDAQQAFDALCIKREQLRKEVVQ